MKGHIFVCVFVLSVVALCQAQVPGFGGCPDFVAMPDFDMSKFLGTWYETERYVNIFEAGSRCVKTNYTKAVDGRFLVASEIMNRFTGVKRVLEGEIKLIVKGTKSELNVRYPNLPIPYDTQYTVLDTNYDEYAVVWSCSSLGIVNTQNAWILTREKLPSGTALQKAYGVLDKYKLSRYFFSKTDQNDCHIAEAANDQNNAIDPDGNDAVEQTADGVYKSVEASPVANAAPEANPSPVAAAEASPVATASGDSAPVAAAAPVPAADAEASPAAVAQPSPVSAPVTSVQEESVAQKIESPVVQNAAEVPAPEVSKSETPSQSENNVVSAVEEQQQSVQQVSPVVGTPVKETIVQSAPLPKSHGHVPHVSHASHHHHSKHSEKHH